MTRAAGMTTAFKAAMAAQLTGTQCILLATITHPDFDTIRIARSREDVVSNGETFTAWDFDLVLPPDQPDRPYRTQIILDNTTHWLTPFARAATPEAEVLLEIVSIEEPDDVQASWPILFLTDVSYGQGRVVGTLTVETLLAEPFPGDPMTPFTFPGMF